MKNKPMKEQIEVHNGQEYKPMQYPVYRKIGDSRLFKMASAEVFINVVETPDSSIIGYGKMAVQALPGFMSSSSDATAEEYNTIYSRVLEKIQQA